MSELYQIGINCLVATRNLQGILLAVLYQIGINCLVATHRRVQSKQV